MFVPIGDDVKKRDFPAVGMILIAICIVVFMYQNRLWNDFEATLPKKTVGDYFDEDGFNAYEAQKYSLWKRSEHADFCKKWGASERNLRAGHFPSLATHQFLHGDFLHLLGNMLMLWAFVGTLENVMGAGFFFTCYVLWGIVAAFSQLAYMWGYKDPTFPLIGASGAISGMIGAYFVAFGALTKIRCLLWFIVPIKVINVPAGAFVFLWVLSQLSGADEAQKYGQIGIAWWAHIGGFAIGALTMLTMRKQVLGQLERDRYTGELVVQGEKKTMQAKVEQPGENGEAPAAPAPFPTCPGCGTVLAEENRIHESLFRCPKGGCQRLIMHSG